MVIAGKSRVLSQDGASRSIWFRMPRTIGSLVLSTAGVSALPAPALLARPDEFLLRPKTRLSPPAPLPRAANTRPKAARRTAVQSARALPGPTLERGSRARTHRRVPTAAPE